MSEKYSKENFRSKYNRLIHAKKAISLKLTLTNIVAKKLEVMSSGAISPFSTMNALIAKYMY